MIHGVNSQMIHKPQGRPLHPALFGNEPLLQLLNISIILDGKSHPSFNRNWEIFFWQCWHVMTSGIGTGGLKREVRSNIHHKKARLKGGRLTSPVRSSKKQVSTHFVPFFVLQIYGRVNKRSGMRLFGEKCSFMPRGNVQTVCWERHSTQFPSQKKTHVRKFTKKSMWANHHLRVPIS